MPDEQAAYEVFRQKYLAMHPLPRKPNAARLDWKFFLVLIVVPAQILLAALRTASIFYKSAELSGSPTLAYAEAGLAIIAVEVALVAYSAIRAAHRKTVNEWISSFGIFLMVGISVFAGLSQAVHLIDEIDPTTLRYLQYSVSLMVGIGASIIAWIGGELLGSQVAEVSIKTQELMREYDAEMQDYTDRLNSSWASSSERKIAREEINEQLRSLQGPVNVHRRSPMNRSEHFEASGNRDAAFAYIDRVLVSEQRMPGPTELAEALNIQKSSAHYFIQKWGEKNG